MLIDSPCHDCEFRHTDCHIECQVYADYKAELDKAKKAKKEETETRIYIIESVYRKRRPKNENNL